jgi:hypothetical protein
MTIARRLWIATAVVGLAILEAAVGHAQSGFTAFALQGGSVSGLRGAVVNVPVTTSSTGTPAAGVSVDLLYNPAVISLTATSPSQACTLGSQQTTQSLSAAVLAATPSGQAGIRLMVLPPMSGTPTSIAAGTLATCQFRIDAAAPLGASVITATNVSASNASGQTPNSTTVGNGQVTVVSGGGGGGGGGCGLGYEIALIVPLILLLRRHLPRLRASRGLALLVVTIGGVGLFASNARAQVIGACCFGNGVCGDVYYEDCLAERGRWNGNGSTCDASECLLGLCCQAGTTPSGQCTDYTTKGECENFLCGKWFFSTTCSQFGGSQHPGTTCGSLFPWPHPGDCHLDGHTTVDELVTMVGIAIGTLPPAYCVNGDLNHDGRITVDEIISAVNAALCYG